MTTPVSPIFLCERGMTPSGRWSVFTLQGVYRTPQALEIDLEGIDVEEGVYRAFDAEGRVLTLRPRDSASSLVRLEAGHEFLPTDLEVVLRRDFADRGDTELARDATICLEQLAQKYEAQLIPRQAGGLRAKIETAVIVGIVLAIVVTFFVGVGTVLHWLIT